MRRNVLYCEEQIPQKDRVISVQTAAFVKRVGENIARVIVGKEGVIETLLAALIAKGHVLLEDVPGTGKTMLCKSLAKSLACRFTRIQFTPDLMPSDVTGTSVYQPATGEFCFQPGPVFTNILLADEINRATPRTQSALLECMEERQVSDSGVTRTLEEPFLVVATQNPVEIQGTFALPEAQLDRFLMRLSMGYPEGAEAVEILTRFLTSDPAQTLSPVASGADLLEAQAACPGVQVSVPVMEYIAALCEYTRKLPQVLLGASPRGMLALMRASQALALIRGRDFVTPDDVKALAVPVLAHRVIVRGVYGKTDAGQAAVREALTTVPVPTETPDA
ncbi:MAG: MoxR family ATPase [Firmicutes bacterium]|nr:MoxR family ATPase [Bacillota bacterium]